MAKEKEYYSKIINLIYIKMVMHLAIQALSLAVYRHATETKETNISNKGVTSLKIPTGRRQTSWLFTKRDLEFECPAILTSRFVNNPYLSVKFSAISRLPVKTSQLSRISADLRSLPSVIKKFD